MEIQKPDITPVPVVEITNAVKDTANTVGDASRRLELKMETKFTLRDDHDEKSIASDSELMKILEEDNTTAEDTKIICKKEDVINQNKSHILLDALTKNSVAEEKYKNLITSSVKTDAGKEANKCCFCYAYKKHSFTPFLYRYIVE